MPLGEQPAPAVLHSHCSQGSETNVVQRREITVVLSPPASLLKLIQKKRRKLGGGM